MSQTVSRAGVITECRIENDFPGFLISKWLSAITLRFVLVAHVSPSLTEFSSNNGLS